MKKVLCGALALLAFTANNVISKMTIAIDDDSCLTVESKFRFDPIYFDDNLRLLNSHNKYSIPETGDCFDLDKTFRSTHAWDIKFKYRYGECTHSYPVVKFDVGIRSNGVWGDPNTMSKTGLASIKDGEAVASTHQHPISVFIPIIREVWGEGVLRDILGLDVSPENTFRLGLFSFKLGRGIALGDAYSLFPDFLGYDPENAVQQYAPGFLLHGVFGDSLDYDLYLAILKNRSGSFKNVNERIRGQEYDHEYCQARGFGIINYIVAGRLIWNIFDQCDKKLHLEPYALFNRDNEQKVEFLGDATSKLTTFGCALEGEVGNWEFGFDMAFNAGSQKVKGVDRNIIQKEARNGVPVYVNSKVTALNNSPSDAPADRFVRSGDYTNDVANKKAIYTPINQTVIDAVRNNSSENGQEFTNANGDTLKNADDRFRDPYKNSYDGSMMVFDVAYNSKKHKLQVAATGGFATGDENPNKDLYGLNDSRQDGDYEGFIGLQAIYAGKRVRSALLMKGNIPRVLSFPANDLNIPRFASRVLRFNNLVFTGGALWWKPCLKGRKWQINPNVLAYWQQYRTRKWDCSAGQRSEKLARGFLGMEYNIFIDVYLMPNLKWFNSLALFVPGNHYRDVAGLPLNKDQQKYLDLKDKTGIVNSCVPTLGHDTAYFADIGFEYKF